MANNHKKSKHAAKSGLGIPVSGSRTDVGLVRDHNEDNLIVKHPLYAVFDGMGGHAAGEVASEIACEVVTQRAPEEAIGELLGRAVEEANLAIIRAAREGKGKPGMGTTCTAGMLEGEKLVLAQVGDSRCYLLHDGTLTQLTRDHSYVADLVEQGQITKDYARVHPMRSRITRALGTDPNMVADIYEITVESGDRLLFCSDGLYSMVSDDDIEHILKQCRDPQEAADKLVDEANGWGGHDNTTVIVVDVSGFSEIKRRKIARKTKIWAAIIVLALIGAIYGAYALFDHFTNTATYLADCNGKVAIYTGYPGDTVGGKTDDLTEVSDVKTDELDSNISERVKSGSIRCSDIEEARSLIKQYEQNIADTKAEKEKQEKAKSESEGNTENSQEGATAQNSSSIGAVQ